MITARQYQIAKAGSLKRLRMIHTELPEPASNEVTVTVKAIGLNFADIFAIQGLYSATPEGAFVPGLEYAGEITAVGNEVSVYKIGDRVMGGTRFGGYTSHINMDYRYVTPIPKDWSYAEGAGFIVQGLTAYYALTKLGDLQQGQTVLIHSAAGGVGILANRIAKKYDAYTIGTVGRPEKVQHLLETENYDRIIVRSKDFPKQLKVALDERPLNIIMECIGGRILKEGYRRLTKQGRMVVYGSASFTSHTAKPNYLKLIIPYLFRPKIDPMKMPTQNKSVMGFNLIYLYDQVDMLQRMLDELMALNLRPQYIGHTFPFEELPQALRLFQSGKTMGKVVVEVDN